MSEDFQIGSSVRDLAGRRLLHAALSGIIECIDGKGLDPAARVTFAFEPNCAMGRRVVNLGGMVIVGEEKPLELNQIATRILRM